MNELDRPMPPAHANLITLCACCRMRPANSTPSLFTLICVRGDWIQFVHQNTGPIGNRRCNGCLQQLLHGLTASDPDAVTRVERNTTIELK
jgi:hypothetical protein